MFPTLYLNVNIGKEKIPFEFLNRKNVFHQYNILYAYEDEVATIYVNNKIEIKVKGNIYFLKK